MACAVPFSFGLELALEEELTELFRLNELSFCLGGAMLKLSSFFIETKWFRVLLGTVTETTGTAFGRLSTGGASSSELFEHIHPINCNQRNQSPPFFLKSKLGGVKAAFIQTPYQHRQITSNKDFPLL